MDVMLLDNNFNQFKIKSTVNKKLGTRRLLHNYLF